MISFRAIRFCATIFCLFLCPYIPALFAVKRLARSEQGSENYTLKRSIVVQAVAWLLTFGVAVWVASFGTENGLIDFKLFFTSAATDVQTWLPCTTYVIASLGVVTGIYLLHSWWRIRSNAGENNFSFAAFGISSVLYGVCAPQLIHDFYGALLDSHLMGG